VEAGIEDGCCEEKGQNNNIENELSSCGDESQGCEHACAAVYYTSMSEIRPGMQGHVDNIMSLAFLHTTRTVQSYL
jgi:hypothetical protein